MFEIYPARDPLPDLFHDISLEEALTYEMKFMFRGKRHQHSLWWIVHNQVGVLEHLMNFMTPGTVEFSALCKVYETYELQVREAIEPKNRKRQLKGIAALKRLRKNARKRVS